MTPVTPARTFVPDAWRDICYMKGWLNENRATMSSWIELKKDRPTGIELIRAHFGGHAHAYDPHWHDDYLVGVTEQGVQQFHCRSQRHRSTPGQVFLLEPGELHDGDAPAEEGFTYQMLYLNPQWLDLQLRQLFAEVPDSFRLSFAATLSDDRLLAQVTMRAFSQLQQQDEGELQRQFALDNLLCGLTRHVHWRRSLPSETSGYQARRIRDYLHANSHQDIRMETLTALTGLDRFRLTRLFRQTFGLPPHAYLVQLRLAQARRLLATGAKPIDVAAQLGFADQSHLGRWFQRAYRLTPAHYRKLCTNLPD